RSEPEFFATLAPLEYGREQIVEIELLLAQSLFVAIARNRVDVLEVPLGRAVFPGVVADDLLLLFPGFAIPDQRDHARVLHPLHGDGLGLVEGMKHVDRNPRIAIHDLLLDAEDMHDREDASALEI